jgi:hypothetical protein
VRGLAGLTATTGYEPGDPNDVCWNVAFGCLALAALLDHGDLARADIAMGVGAGGHPPGDAPG